MRSYIFRDCCRDFYWKGQVSINRRDNSQSQKLLPILFTPMLVLVTYLGID